MSAQHTPGPWRVERQNPSPTTGEWMIAAGTKHGYLAEVRDCGSGDVQANARLIAAAPELLAALQAVLAEIDGPDRPHSTDSWLPSHLAHQVRVAVANATRPGSWSNA
ncbi:MAG: hypothetical protein ACYCXC_00025 [Acidovorax defluvii]